MSNKSKRKERGITLVALIITIIVLIILAAVTINAAFKSDFIGTATNGTINYANSQSYEQGMMDELSDKLNKLSDKILRISLGEVVETLDNGVTITATITQNEDWENPVVTVTGTITKEGGTIVSTTATATNGVIIPSDFPTRGGEYTIGNITKNTDIEIKVTDSEGNTASKIIEVRLARDTKGPEFSETVAKASGMKIKISATALDNMSGVKQITYSVSPTTISPTSGELQLGEEVELTATAEGKYTVTFTATDNANNTSTAVAEATAVEGGVIKHINTTEGLKEVNTKVIYGSDVLGYSCTRKKDDGSNLEWQIFYIDETKNAEGNVTNSQVYLISKDYMEPPTTGTELTKGSYSAYYWSTTVLDKYVGTIPNTPFTQKFLEEYANVSASSQQNLQATNYMLDQEVWSEYMSTNGKSDYAFGGPTLPLFQASYNDICKTETRLGIVRSGTGYLLKFGTGDWATGQGSYGTTNTQKGIYFKGSNYNGPARSLWLASPGSDDSSFVIVVHFDGIISGDMYDSSVCGFRTVVCLKPTVQFVENADGSYTIVN